jgi:hypothetical protein
LPAEADRLASAVTRAGSLRLRKPADDLRVALLKLLLLGLDLPHGTADDEATQSAVLLTVALERLPFTVEDGVAVLVLRVILPQALNGIAEQEGMRFGPLPGIHSALQAERSASSIELQEASSF